MDTNELIAHYFLNTLSPEAQKQFDHLMATDSEFAKEVRFQNNLKTVIKKEEQIQVKNKLRAFETKNKVNLKNHLKWLAAASIVVLLAITSFIYFSQTNINNEDLFASNFKPYKNVVHPIVRGHDSNDLKTKAFITYEARQYKEALVHFNTILQDTIEPEILFYKANILLQLGNYDDAIAILSNNKTLKDSLRDQQQWYLALAYVRVGNNKKATELLKDLVQKSDYKNVEAQKLLEQLE